MEVYPETLTATSFTELYVHGNPKGILGRGAQDGHLDFPRTTTLTFTLLLTSDTNYTATCCKYLWSDGRSA